jgi:hypothetical protein
MIGCAPLSPQLAAANTRFIFDVMTALSKILLTLSLTGFTAGSVIDFGGFNLNPSWTVALPLGAVFFGLFVISFMLEKEMAKFDEEEAKKLQLIQCDIAAPVPVQKPTIQRTIIQLKGKTLLHEH